MSISNVKKLVVAAVVSLGLACVGPAGEPGAAGAQGPVGPAGAVGPTGPGFEAGPSISAIEPSWIVVGGQQTVQISGFATTWEGSTPTVNFGAGITVDNVVVASNTALLVDLTVAADATTGTRNVTVSEGGETASYQNAFAVRPVMGIELLGAAQQLGVFKVQLTSNDPEFVMPQSMGDVSVNAPTGVNYVEQLSFSTASTLTLFLAVDMDATLGAGELVVNLFPGDPRARTVAAPVDVTAVSTVDGMIGTAATSTLSTAHGSTAFKMTAQASEEIAVSVSGADASARFAVVDSSGTFSGVVADFNNPIFNATMGSDYYVVVWAGDVASGVVTLNMVPTPTVNEIEPNDDPSTATLLPSLPVKVLGAELTGTTDVDYYKVTVDASSVGRSIQFAGNTNTSYADYTVELIAPNGASLGVSDNLYYESTSKWLSPALSAPGEYLVKVTCPTTYDGSYEFAAILQ